MEFQKNDYLIEEHKVANYFDPKSHTVSMITGEAKVHYLSFGEKQTQCITESTAQTYCLISRCYRNLPLIYVSIGIWNGWFDELSLPPKILKFTMFLLLAFLLLVVLLIAEC